VSAAVRQRHDIFAIPDTTELVKSSVMKISSEASGRGDLIGVMNDEFRALVILDPYVTRSKLD